MARPVTMTVNNFTGKTLKLTGTDVEHGKFTDDPPKLIKYSGAWACSTRSGAMIGPKGTATYEADDGSFSVVFFWNHPYGSATSSYRVTPSPDQSIAYEILGSFEGHSQEIQFQLYPA